MNKLEQARTNINTIDEKMAKLFEERMKCVEDVISYKLENNLPILDTNRENLVIEKNLTYINEDKYKEYYISYIKDVMAISRKYQKGLINKDVIGYGGTKGAFSHIAASYIFPYNKQKDYKSFEEVFIAIEEGEIERGVIPFENSYTGEVGEVLDLLNKYDVFIQQIYDLKVNQNLLVVKGTKYEDIKQVYSHPQAISQSAKFLKGRSFEIIPYGNTALAAKYVSETNDKSKAAIASKETAELYDLEILEENINTSSDNTTRFIVISKNNSCNGNRFNLLFTLKHDAGQLAKVMQVIKEKGFNMESIKSRSLHNEPWKYYFYVEIVGELQSINAKALIEELKVTCEKIKVLGSYTLNDKKEED
ncbi:MAG: chorismate mutase [Erysipelotrichaceae bacterium]